MEDGQAIRQKLAIANRILVNEGVTELGRGHVCYYLGGGKTLIPAHLHAYGRTIADCTENDLVTINSDGRVVEGKYSQSMGEVHFYTELFKSRSDVRAGAHIHPFYANVLAMAGKKLVMSSRDSFLFVEGISEYEGLPLYVKDKETGRAMVEKLANRHVIIHRGHGAFVAGETVEDVVIRAAALERAAKKQVLTSLLGTPLTYDEGEVRKTHTKEIYMETASIDWGYFMMRLQKTGIVL
jgi:ribulose-5-phosphate 4-epimerase/fuculose-1-phosphate aldolase